MNKNILLIAAFVCVAMLAQAQETKTKHHDIRIMVNNIANRNNNDFMEWLYYYEWFDYDYVYFDFPNDFYNKKNYGLGYRYRFGNNALRFNVGFNYTTQKNNENTSTMSSSHISKLKFTLTDMNFSLGYQRDFVFDKCHLYIGADAKFNYMLFDEDYTITYDYPYPNPDWTDYSIKNTTLGIGGGPFIGIEYFFIPALSLSVETGFDYFYEKIGAKYNRVPNDDEPDVSNREDSKNYFKFNPLSTISVNVHL